MKEKILNLKENKKAVILLILLLMMICVGISYAYWLLTIEQQDTNIVNTGCFNIVFTEKNDIRLDKAYPMKDTEASSLAPYTFTIENTCDSPASYQINLETMSQSSGTKTLPDEYLKANLIEVDSTNTSTNNLTSKYEVEKTIENAVKAYKLDTGIIKGKEKKTFELRLWLDYDTPVIDEVMNATYNGKISIISSYLATPSNMLMATDFDISLDFDADTELDDAIKGDINLDTMQIISDSFWQHNLNIKTITFESSLNPKENATYTYDISANQDGSVMAYLVENGTVQNPIIQESIPAYDMYIQANGKVYANYDSSFWFSFLLNLTEINNIENLDTSYVTDMSDMFFYMQLLTTLDLSSFDTSNVTDMTGMISGTISLTTLDLSDFDTSNVTDMSYMFASMQLLTTLDLSSFNTSNVTNMSGMFSGSALTELDLSKFDTSNVTDMSKMFYEADSFTTLDLSSFDTSNVTDMSGMFENMNTLTILDLSNFNTSNVTDMNSMFYATDSLTTLDVSGFDTSNVIDMSWMFRGLNNLTTLDLSSFDTSNVTDMNSMFYGSIKLRTIVYGSNFIYANNANVSDMFLVCSANRPTDPSWQGLVLD
mgnify:FL=1